MLQKKGGKLFNFYAKFHLVYLFVIYTGIFNTISR